MRLEPFLAIGHYSVMSPKISTTPFRGDQPLVKEMRRFSGDVIAWWYGGIVHNQRDNTQPKVVLGVRSVQDSGVLGKHLTTEIPISYLPIVPVGSVWRDCRRVADEEMAAEVFAVDFVPNPVFVSISRAAGDALPFSFEDYQFTKDGKSSQIMSLSLAGGRTLLLPSLEMLARFYARSGETIRVLATYDWEEALQRLSSVPQVTPPGNGWAITLGKKIPLQDAAFISAVRYDQTAEAAAKTIRGQLLTAFHNGAAIAYPKVGPWFTGQSKIRASGRWVNGGKSFLVLRLLGLSFPPLPPITVVGKAWGDPDPDDDGGGSGGGPRRPRFKLNSLDPAIPLTGDEAPDGDGAIVAIAADPFIIDNPPVLIRIDLPGGSPPHGGGAATDGDPKYISGGDPHGRGKGGAEADIRSDVVMESHGVVGDMWNALVDLHRATPSKVSGPEWYQLGRGFVDGVEPQLIALIPGKSAWSKYEGRTPAVRGILVARLVIDGQGYCIVEVERRQSDEGDKENFCGLIFAEPSPADLVQWIARLLIMIPEMKGIVSKLAHSCPTAAYAFRHPTSQQGRRPAETALEGALRKVGFSQ